MRIPDQPEFAACRTVTSVRAKEEIIAFCAGNIATFRVPRYVRFVDEWPMSGTKIRKAILREMIAADLKEKGITRAPKIESAPSAAS